MVYSNDNTAVTVTAQYTSASLKSTNYNSAVVTIDASERTKALNISGNSNANRILGTTGNDTINGGTGNDTLTGGAGKDLFVYSAGNDVVTDYVSGEDTIKIASGTISAYSASGNDLVMNIGSGNVKVVGGKDSAVTIVDSKNKSAIYEGGLVYNSATTKATAITVTGAYGNRLSDYGAAVVTIDATARDTAIDIVGNAKANKIYGTAGKDTLAGGKGNDTLYGGDGADIFIYENGDGTDVIADYTAGEDTIKIASGSISAYSISGKDATFKVGSGTIKVSGGKTSAITIVDAKNNVTTYDGGLIYNGTVAKAKAVTVSAAYGNTLASYGASVITIDGTARTKALNITGNAAANKILGTSGNDTIYGGAGNDTLTGGKGKDLFVYETGDGNDVITDYTAGQDTIKIASGTVSSYSISGNDASFKVGSGTIKVSGGKTSAVTIIDENKNTYTYQSGAIYNNATPTKATAITLTSGYGSSISVGNTVVTVDASPRTSAIKIVANAKNNTITGSTKNDTIDGGAGNDSINGGKGNDTITGGTGNDVFIYANGDGNDVITDYEAGKDKIKLVSGSVSAYSVKSGDAILKVGSGAITLKGAGASAITVVDANDVVRTYQNGLIYDNTRISRSKVVTITAGYEESELGNYGASVETIDASSRSKAIEIVGNTGANYIIGSKAGDTIDGGKGDDTIIGGKGNDTLTGGRGRDVFVYSSTSEGNDVITDYTGGEDIISLTGSYAVKYSTKNNDAILQIGSGKVTLKNAADAAVTIVGEGSVASIASGGKISTKTWTGLSGEETVYVTLPAETITIGGGETVTVNETVEVTLPAETVEVTLPAETVNVTLPAVTLPAETINVTLPAETITVGGDGGGSIVIGTSGNDTLYGSGGDDTFTGAAGNDVFVYGGGFDIITDYGTGSDTISIGANAINGGMAVGNDVLMAIGGGLIKILGAKNKAVSIAGSSGASVYSNGAFVSESISPNGVTVTLDASLESWSAFSLEAYNETANVKAVNVDGSALRNPIYLNADDNPNIIWAGKNGGNIYALEGDDTIFCGDGDDQIYYTKYGGSDVIYNYQTGDRLDFYAHLDSSSYDHFQNFSFSGNDVILNLKSGEKITLKDAKNQRISLESYYEDHDGTGWHNINNTVGKVTISGGTATLASDYAGDYFDVSNYAEEITNVDASAVREWITLYGNDSANVIRAGREGGEIRAGEGNDTIYCGRGDDQIYYTKYGGSDVIYNFQTGDRIDFSTNEHEAIFKNISFSGSDVIINLESGDTVTLKDAKDQRIHIYGYYTDHDGEYWHTIDNTVGKVTISGSSATLASDYLGYFDVTNYAESITNIDASAVRTGVDLYGNDSANVIRAGRDGGSIRGGEGNDTIYCGRGTDNIRYDAFGGSDVIYNFQTGDKIHFSTDEHKARFKNISFSGNDVIINLDSGDTVTLKDAKDQRIHIDGYYTDHDGEYWHTIDNTVGKVTISGSSATLASDYAGDYFDVSNYAASIKTVDASAVREVVNLYGDDSDNVLRASRAGGDIDAGKGNDTIYCSSRAEDRIYHGRSSGNDVIYDISADDNIQLMDCSAENVSIRGSDVIITTDYDDTIIVKNASSVNFKIGNRSWQEYTSNGNAAVPWFAEDDTNFTTTADLDSLIDTGAALTDFKFDVTPADIFAQETLYSADK